MRNEQTLRKREEEKKADDDRINSFMNKMQKFETKRKVTEKNMRLNAQPPMDKLTPAQRLLEIKNQKANEMKEQARKIKLG